MRSATLPLAAVILAGCTSQVSPSELWSQPESQLIYPGAIVLDKRESDARPTLESEISASVGYLLGSDDGAEAIETYYANELARLGWRAPDDYEARGRGIRTTAELSARSWRKDDLVFRVGILDKSHPAAEGPSEGYETVFRFDLISAPPPEPRPT